MASGTGVLAEPEETVCRLYWPNVAEPRGATVARIVTVIAAMLVHC